MSALQKYKKEAQEQRARADAAEIRAARMTDLARLLRDYLLADIGLPCIEQERALNRAFPDWKTIDLSVQTPCDEW